MIRFDSSILSLILWPFYTAYEAAFIFGISGFAFGVFHYLDLDDATLVTFGGLAGAWAMTIWSASASMVIHRANLSKIEDVLVGMEYTCTEKGWIPPLPEFLRWPRNRIEIAELDGCSIVVRGPRNSLAHLRSSIEPELP